MPLPGRHHHNRRNGQVTEGMRRTGPFAVGDDGPPPERAAPPASTLRRRLVLTDLVAVATAWSALAAATGSALGGSGWLAAGVQVALASALTLATLHRLRLYQARVCADRRLTRRRLVLAAGVAPLALTGAGVLAGTELEPPLMALSVAGPLLALAVAREAFEQWLRASRLRGRHVRPVVLAGTVEEVRQIARLLDAHPEAGFHPVGWIGRTPLRRARVATGNGDLCHCDHLGSSSHAVSAACSTGATGVLAGPSAAGWPGFAKMTRELQEAGLHLQVWSGVWGVSSHRLRPAPLAHEPFFYVEGSGTLARAAWIKRGMDVVLASAALVAASPVLGAAALAVKLSDRGPVLFRQKRVGRYGEVFELRKLRTMRVDAERHLDRLKAENERSGPLFKLASDPRVTPVGRVLRATSIDELPQLLDVIAGRLSLVGPRPALPSEVAEFDQALLDRHNVLPGLTGLWQAEARHNPSFDAYRHLDLFYVENWTVTLDVLILLATVRTVLHDTAQAGWSFLGRIGAAVTGRRRSARASR